MGKHTDKYLEQPQPTQPTGGKSFAFLRGLFRAHFLDMSPEDQAACIKDDRKRERQERWKMRWRRLRRVVKKENVGEYGGLAEDARRWLDSINNLKTK